MSHSTLRTSFSSRSPSSFETTRRRLCTALGRQAIAQAPPLSHELWLHESGAPPCMTSLPVGNYYSLLNHVKVLQQYTELLSEAASGNGPHADYLLARPDSCVGDFGWFESLCAPLADTGFDHFYQRLIYQWREGNPGLHSEAEAAYHVYQSNCKTDLDLVRHIVLFLKPGAKEYEVRVAKNILDSKPATYDEFHSDFLNWRKRGLYHALCLAAKAMPSVEDWVPVRMVSESDELESLLKEFNVKGSCSSHRMAQLFEGISCRSDLFSNCVCGTLDRVAHLMRVPSDTGPDSLGDRDDETLDDLVQQLRVEVDTSNPYRDSIRVWRGLKSALETSLPPSMLCPALDPPNRSTWGYRRLSLRVNEDTGKVYIDHGPLQWMERASYVSLKDDGVFYTPERLRDILFRMGEAVTSPELGQLLFSWKQLSGFLHGDAKSIDDLDSYKNFYSDRGNVLKEMASMHPWMRNCTLDSKTLDIKKDIFDLVPTPSQADHSPPLRILAYRVDCPSKVILYQGSSTDMDFGRNPPHTLKKTSYPDKVHNRTLSGVALIPDSTSDFHEALRAVLAHKVAAKHDDFADHSFHKSTIRNQETNKTHVFTSTILAESVALFTGPKPSQISLISLNESVPWDGERIDHRYAEHQEGSNGSRYRDWASMYHDGPELHRSRLASHEVKVDQTYHTHFPVAERTVALDGKQKYSWVSVCSSLPAEVCVLRDLGGYTRLESLKRSVENRFMNDSKLLPVRVSGDTIERCNMELYSDEGAGQVMIAYTPTAADGGRRNVEMISFRFH